MHLLYFDFFLCMANLESKNKEIPSLPPSSHIVFCNSHVLENYAKYQFRLLYLLFKLIYLLC